MASCWRSETSFIAWWRDRCWLWALNKRKTGLDVMRILNCYTVNIPICFWISRAYGIYWSGLYLSLAIFAVISPYAQRKTCSADDRGTANDNCTICSVIPSTNWGCMSSGEGVICGIGCGNIDLGDMSLSPVDDGGDGVIGSDLTKVCGSVGRIHNTLLGCLPAGAAVASRLRAFGIELWSLNMSRLGQLHTLKCINLFPSNSRLKLNRIY